jgi:hypothetical protein
MEGNLSYAPKQKIDLDCGILADMWRQAERIFYSSDSQASSLLMFVELIHKIHP